MPRHSSSHDPVASFRRQTGGGGRADRIPYTLREKLVFFTLALLIVFLGWGIGGLRTWSVITIFCLSCLTFLTLWIPLGRMAAVAEGDYGFGERLKVMLRFPLFWCGFGFLVYITIQGLNPAWEYTTSEDGNRWWLTGIPHNKSLPTGMITPFDLNSPWRQLMIYSSALMAICTAWVGVRRRELMIGLLWVMVVSATLMAIVGLLQRFTGTKEMFWFIEGVPRYFFGSFTYKNHAGAYLVLCSALAMGLFLYHMRRSRQQMAKSGPHYLLLMVIPVMTVGVFYSDSRGALLLGIPLLLIFIVLVALEFFLGLRQTEGSGILLSSVCLFWVVVFGSLLYTFLDPERIQQRLNIVFKDAGKLEEGVHVSRLSHNAKQRYYIYAATWDIVKDVPVFGVGAGGFRFYFPVYQQKEEHASIYKAHKRKGRQRYWAVYFAHCDWLQFPAEFGMVGCSFIVAAFLWGFAFLMSQFRRWRTWHLMLSAAIVYPLLHALFDFILQSPSILIIWLLVASLAIQIFKLRRIPI